MTRFSPTLKMYKNTGAALVLSVNSVEHGARKIPKMRERIGKYLGVMGTSRLPWKNFTRGIGGWWILFLDHPKIGAFCYTQLTDVEQEMNGIYTYDRKCKFDMELIRSITSRKAAIE